MNSTAAIKAAAPAGLAAKGGELSLCIFAATVLCVSLFAQRLAVPAGGRAVDAVGPICLLLAAWAVLRGRLVFHPRRLAIFCLLVAWAVIGTLWQSVHPNAYGTGISIDSLMQFLLLTSFAVLVFSRKVSEAVFFRGAANILALIAAAGVLQFLLQFIGAGVFEFTGILPARMLFEAGYNLAIPVGIGDALKANGFFLLEPSIFSQAMAMALIIEALAARRPWFMALFLAGLVLSFSGTGWIVLASFLMTVGARLGGRGVAIALGATMAILVLATIAAVLSPDVAAIFTDRFAELSQPGTSGNLRFATPFHMMHDVLAHEPSAWLAGIGPGASERLDLAYEYTVNTPIKIMLEYGLPAVILYVAIFISGERTRMQAALVVPSIVLIMLTGGYQEFAPVLFPIMLLICVARLQPALPARQAAAR